MLFASRVTIARFADKSGVAPRAARNVGRGRLALSTAALVAPLAGVLASVPAAAKDFVVTNFATLNAAIADAGNGDRITLKRNITLKGDLIALTKNAHISPLDM